MRRTRIDLLDICGWDNLVDAAHKAAKGKRTRPVVREFFDDFSGNINRLGRDILSGRLPDSVFRSFEIRDPKKRCIQAPSFQDRIVHHAIINLAGPVLERAMVTSSFACLPGRGTEAAARKVQWCMRRFPWYVKVDVRKFFDSIDHDLLLGLLAKRFKGREFLALMARIVHGYHRTPGKGLPIGSLTSQYMANYFLDGADRFILEQLACSGYVRYMDDLIWWCATRDQAKASLKRVQRYLLKQRCLELNEQVRINRSSHGVEYCGYRITSGAIRLSKRRCRRYLAGRRSWEQAYEQGIVNGVQLQQAYAAVHAITAQAQSRGWRRQSLHRVPPPDP